jgi:hypothetical protein
VQSSAFTAPTVGKDEPAGQRSQLLADQSAWNVPPGQTSPLLGSAHEYPGAQGVQSARLDAPARLLVPCGQGSGSVFWQPSTIGEAFAKTAVPSQ